MEAEKNAIPCERLTTGQTEIAITSHTEIVSLFEQTVLITLQPDNSLAYQKRINIFSTLINKTVTVKEMCQVKV